MYFQNAEKNIYLCGEAAYPWSEEAIKALEEKEAKWKEEMKSKIVDLQCFAPTDTCHVVDKSGNYHMMIRYKRTH